MKKGITKLIATIMLIISVVFAGFTFSTNLSNPAYAVPEDEDTTIDNPADTNSPDDTDTSDSTTNDTEDGEDGDTDNTTVEEATVDICRQETGGLYWIVCPAISLASKATDALYTVINDFLVVNPLEMTNDSPVYQVWQYMRNITNIVFGIFLAIVIYSQLTGLGINNYGIKRVLPRLIITIILVNLSFYICALMTDVSNIFGENLRAFFQGIQDAITVNGAIGETPEISQVSILTVIISGGSIAGIVIGATGGIGGLLWAFVAILIAGLIAIITGLITIAARQAIITLLVMVSPLAFVAYLLPNTERWFGRWKEMFARMLVFYPVFSFLFGASKLAGWAIIASATGAPAILLGTAVQIFPLFASWSLMKMSGSVLGTLNAAMRRAAAPAQKFATDWANEHADRSRQNYWLNNYSTGSRLRGFLDYRQKLRLLDAQNAREGRENRALDRAYRKAASITGRDELGNTTFENTANRYTRNAKTSKYFDLRATGSQLAYKNTLSGYGRIFGNNDSSVKKLANASWESFTDLATQKYLEVNEAQADQEQLLQRYLAAENNSEKDVYEYNRLIKGASGSLRHFGASSIMGQVIQGVSAIEQRRRSEARIMITKFGVDKASFRGMAFDINHIGDDGFEHDEHGHVIEDDMYNIKPGYKHTPWQHYIGVHKQTGEEITKEEYDNLSLEDRTEYRKVRYFDMRNDKREPVQRVFEDDPGFMKELFLDDINIADPIVNRYGFSTGVGRKLGEEDGILRRYHSTISAGLLASGYKEHHAAYTSMLAAHIDGGEITTPGQLNIAKLLSFNASAKSNMLPVNDVYAVQDFIKQLPTVKSAGLFSHYFPDFDIETFASVNHEDLGGLRKAYKVDESGNFILDENQQKIPYWQEIERTDPNITTDDRRNYIKHKVFAKSVKKLVGIVGRELSPGIRENQKPETLMALLDLADVLVGLGTNNVDPNVPFEEKIDPSIDLFAAEDPSVLKQRIDAGRQEINRIRNGGNNSVPPNNNTPPSGGGSSGGGAPSGGGGPTAPSSGANHPGIPNTTASIQRQVLADAEYRARNSRTYIMDIIAEATRESITVVEYRNRLRTLFYGTECLNKREILDELEYAFQPYLNDLPHSETAALNEVTDFYGREKIRIDELSQTIYHIAEQAQMFL